MSKPKRPSKPKPSGRGDASRSIDQRPNGQRHEGALPSKAEVLAFIEGAREKVGKREIAKAFGIKGDNRIGLKTLIAEMTAEGSLAGNRKTLKQPGRLPPVGILDIVDRDDEGDVVAEPVVWEHEDGPRPRILVITATGNGRTPAMSLGSGDRFLAKISRRAAESPGDYSHEAEPIKKLPREKKRLLGIFRKHPKGGGSIDPVDRRELKTWPVRSGSEGNAQDGDLVRFDIGRPHARGLPDARIMESLGNPRDQRQISLIAVHAHGIPDEFPDIVLREVETLPALGPDGRTDLTTMPLLTIDPPDARDHDDAVHAVADTDPRNAGGFVVTVAIADVAHYVRPGSRLDREAELRGNSVYFPDRVVPMLPERISNDLCSLREGEPRPCLAVTMVFDGAGRKKRHAFQRAMMRSVAKLSYQEAQAAVDGKPSPKAEPLLDNVLRPLWAAYACLTRGRDAREPLDLNLPERKIVMDGDGRVARIMIPERLEAHRLIEEMMIQANVAAAETLEQHRTPCVYRIHDRPSREKLAALGDFLDSLELDASQKNWPKVDGLKPQAFNKILALAKGQPVADLVNEVVLRSQAQAEYNIRNLGHFGLNLERYAHFTSPIRRYADLLVHRALVRAMKFGPNAQADGLPKDDEPRLPDVAKAISDTERRAMAAERETSDRLLAAFLADRVGAEFPARISGVTRSGLFVRLRETGADGFIPASTIGGGEYWRHDETARALIGDRSGKGYRLGDDVDVRLVEAVPMAGAMRFEILSDPQPVRGAASPSRKSGSRKAGPGRDGRGRSPGGSDRPRSRRGG